jgi:hypothetical protein
MTDYIINIVMQNMIQNAKYSVENFGYYKRAIETFQMSNCSDDELSDWKLLCMQTIYDYGKERGVNFLDPNWHNVLLNVRLPPKKVAAFVQVVDFLEIHEIEKQFVDAVFFHLFSEINLCETLDETWLEFFSVNLMFHKYLQIFDNKNYACKVTDEYLMWLNNVVPVVDLDMKYMKKVSYNCVFSLSMLEKLSIYDAKNINAIDFKKLSKLSELHIHTFFVSNSHIENLSDLKTLCVWKFSDYVINYSELNNLETLCVYCEKNIYCKTTNKNFPKLSFLKMRCYCETTYVEHFVNLVHLDISRFGHCDFAYFKIKDLVKLEHLNVAGLGIHDDDIKNLVNLKYLNIKGCKYVHPIALKNLVNLVELNVVHTNITNKGIEHLTKLRKLYHHGSKITYVPEYLKN